MSMDNRPSVEQPKASEHKNRMKRILAGVTALMFGAAAALSPSHKAESTNPLATPGTEPTPRTPDTTMVMNTPNFDEPGNVIHVPTAEANPTPRDTTLTPPAMGEPQPEAQH